jgi:biotin operon repressor
MIFDHLKQPFLWRLIMATFFTEEELSVMAEDELRSVINELLKENQELEEQLVIKNHGRKKQVYDLLKAEGPLTIKDLAKKLKISTKNVSSQLTYLRSDGINIFTDNNGKKFIHTD